MSYNNLIYLPSSLPTSLRELHVNRNRLIGLPRNLPTSLVSLRASGNHLGSLPDNLPAALKVLNASHNQLTFLPDILPASLQTLSVHDNYLRFLPDNLPNSLVSLDVNDTVIRNRHCRGGDFLDKLFLWNNDIDVNKWREIQSEDNAKCFGDFLQKLHQGKNRHNSELKRRITSWLSYLGEDGHQPLRMQTFMLAQEAAENCVDRASFYFTQMHIWRVEHELIKSEAPFSEVVETILGLFRLQVIEQIAAQKVAARRRESPGFDEDLEVHLGYQYGLRTSLALPVYTELQFADIASVNDDDIKHARAVVADKEKTDFLRYWFTESALWSAVLEKWDAQKKAEMEARYLEAISADSFKTAVAQALIKKQLPLDDTDAERAVSRTLAAALFFEQREVLSRACLASSRALSLLDRFSALSLS